ncbi:hypothetical protein [Kitasatospora griseola]|uniref:hypothetical protein n=1 Tax=Kitasatospora griseola TaxID=2064 RepID=UPI00069700F1|nr:hypothetical protein [Kitasatospora griseola]
MVHPSSGVPAEVGRSRAPGALGRLLGPARADVLVLLGAAKANQLVALTAQGLGSVGRHPKVLCDARPVQRRGTGRSVRCFRTDAPDGSMRCFRADAGDVLVRAQSDGG